MSFRRSLPLALMTLILVPIVNILHEAVHALTGIALGYEMGMSMNKAWPIKKSFDEDWHYQLVSITGPIFTICVGVIGMLLASSRHRFLGYALIFIAAGQRLLAMAFSAMGSMNDEARVSLSLGLPWWVLPAIVAGSLFILAVITSWRLKWGAKPNLMAYLGFSLATAAVIFGDTILFGV